MYDLGPSHNIPPCSELSFLLWQFERAQDWCSILRARDTRNERDDENKDNIKACTSFRFRRSRGSEGVGIACLVRIMSYQKKSSVMHDRLIITIYGSLIY